MAGSSGKCGSLPERKELEEGDKAAMLLALREVTQAIVERAHVKRENLYQMLSRRGNPELTSLFNILHGMV